MARYIDADKLKEKKYYDEKRHEYCVSIAEVDWQPTADVREILHAHYDENGDCSNCGCAIPTDDKRDFIMEKEVRYCYYCGAKMEGEE